MNLTADEYRAALRFIETCEDGEGYDVPKPMMKRLAGHGLVAHKGGGWYEGTPALDKLQDEVQKTLCPCCGGQGFPALTDLTTPCTECAGTGEAVLMLGTRQLLSDAEIDEALCDSQGCHPITLRAEETEAISLIHHHE